MVLQIFFQGLYMEENVFEVGSYICPSSLFQFGDYEQQALSAILHEEEIYTALCSMPSFKALGLDGFQVGFICLIAR